MIAEGLVVIHLVIPSPIHAGGIGHGSKVGLVLLVVGRTYVVALVDTCGIENTLALVRIVWRECCGKLQSLHDIGTQIQVTHHGIFLGLVGIVTIIEVNQWVVGGCELCIRPEGSLGTRVRNQIAICICRRYEWVEIKCIHVW